MNRLPTTTEDLHVVCLVKGDERYVFVYDAAVLSQKIRQSTQGET